MRLLRPFVRACALATVVVACTGPTDGSQSAQPVISALPRALSGDEQIAATATTDFGLTLFRTVNAATARDSNLALSPISASVALGMLMNGAELETLDQVRRTLGFGDREVAQVNEAYRALLPLLTTLDPSVKMTFANTAWFDRSAPPSTQYTQRLRDVFDAPVTTATLVDPATPVAINAWAFNATNGRIPSIVQGFSNDDIAFIANATYFKGQWRSQFDAGRTRPAEFRVSSGTTITVPTMFNDAGLFRAASLGGSGVIAELPFGGDAFVMDIVMPAVGGLEPMIDSLTPERWRSMIARLPDSSVSLPVQLPKFRVNTGRELSDHLAAIGMPRPFLDAQLSPMFATPRGGLFVSSVLQKVFVDVNEEGAEAAAVTGIAITSSSAPVGLFVDRPFLFVIRDRLSGTILFIGKVVRPTVG